ncbi:MAG: DUF11 domain-containing protein [Solirubrobacterales bacterium]|nr:DUF11 domain-containing protein [Solirubrobacterales bacterium]
MKNSNHIKVTFAAVLAILVAMVGSLGLATQAQAQKVGNPGPTNIGAVGGSFKFGVLDPLNLDVDPNNPASTITLNGTIDQNGAINIPQANTEFPTFTLDGIAVVGSVDIKVNSVGDINGTLNPLTGATFVPIRLWIKVNSGSALIGSGCALGSAGNPLVIDLTSGTSTPVPASAGPALTGVPYDPDTGLVTVVNAKVAAPASSGCGLAAGTLDSMIGLPAASGKNQIVFEMKLTPIVTRGVDAKITSSSFNTISGATRKMSGSTSIAPAGVQSYRWDYDNDGTWDTAPSATPDTSTVYTGPVGSTRTARLRVVDNQGDAHETTKTFTIVQPSDVTIAKQTVGAFEVGTNPKYRLTVTNNSNREEPNDVVVTDTVPAEFPVQSASGSGWQCSNAGQDVTCTRSKLNANETAPPIDVTVGVTGEALPYKDNTATVTSPSDPDTSNNSATVRSFVFAVDLIVKKSHDYEFRAGADPKNVHVIDVSNRGTASTALPTTVTDTLPAGLTPLTASGPGWNCNIVGQDVTCTSSARIDPDQHATPIEITSSADIDVAANQVGATSALVTNTATVNNTGDVIASNNSDDDPTYIIDTPDLKISKSHVGNMRVGAQADYTIKVANRGPQDTTTTTTVTDVLPDNMSFVATNAPDWDCSAVDQTVTCDEVDPIAADTSAGDIVISVLPNDPGEVVNVATVDNTEDPHAEDNTVEDPTSVRLIDLSISAAQEAPFKVNRDGQYRISLENLGTSDTASATVITSTLPTGVTYADWEGEGWTCAGSSGSNVSCSYADPIAPGTPPNDLLLGVSFLPASVPTTSVDFHVDTDDDYVPGNDDVTVEADVFAMDSSIAITNNGNFRAGINRTYNVAVDNVGTADAAAGTTSVVLDLGTGLTYNSETGSGWSCAAVAQEVTCDYAPVIGAEDSASSLGIQVAVDASARPSVTTTGTVTTTGDRNAGNDTAESVTPVASPDLGVTSSHAGNFRVGTVNSYSLVAKNHGDAATDAATQITDTIPAGLTYVSSTGSGWTCVPALPDVNCTYPGQITAGASAPAVSLKVMPTVAAVPSVTNEVTVSGSPDFNAANDSSSDPTTVTQIDVSSALSGPSATQNVGDDITYTATISNDGTASTISPITVTGTLPPGVVPSQASGSGWNCQVNGLDISCVRGSSLGAGQDAPDISIQALIKPSASSPLAFDVTATTIDDVNSSNDTSNSVSTPIIAGPDGTVSLEAAIPQNLDHLRVGSSGVYHVKVTNEGGLPTSVGTDVVVNMPQGVNPGLSGSDDWPCYVIGRKITCTYVPAIPAKQSTPSFPINFTVDDSAAATVTTDAKVNVTGDLDNGNNEASDTQDIDRTDVGVALSQVGTWTKGETGAFKVTVDNTGSGKTVGPIKVKADLPAGTTYKSVSGSGWACTPSGLSVSCQRNDILSGGASAPAIEIVTDVGTSAADKAPANASVTTTEDIDSSNDTASTPMTIKDAPVTPEVRGAAIVVSKKSRMKRNGTVSVKLSCPADSTTKCSGTAKVKTKGKVKMKKGKKGKRKKLSSSTASFSIAPGQTYPVTVKFARNARKALRIKRSVKTTVKATPTTSDLLPSSGKLTLKTR